MFKYFLSFNQFIKENAVPDEFFRVTSKNKNSKEAKEELENIIKNDSEFVVYNLPSNILDINVEWIHTIDQENPDNNHNILTRLATRSYIRKPDELDEALTYIIGNISNMRRGRKVSVYLESFGTYFVLSLLNTTTIKIITIMHTRPIDCEIYL